jgi:hypothetical protein
MVHRNGAPCGVRRLWLLVLTASLLAWPHAAHSHDSDVPNLANLAALDSYVADRFTELTNDVAMCLSGPFTIGFNSGMFTFSPGSDLAALTNSLPPLNVLGVQTYPIRIVEMTQETSRVWLSKGADGVAVHTNTVPSSFDIQEWVRMAYRHEPPSYLGGTQLAQWYGDRERCRIFLLMTLVSSNDWPSLQAALRSDATNAPLPGTWSPTIPADTNNLRFLNIQPSAGSMDLWIYAPSARRVAVLTSTNLIDKRWSVLGSFGSGPAFNLWHAFDAAPLAMFHAGFVDVDSDGDGLSDLLESYVLGTDPNRFDTTGGTLSDYYRVLVYGLDPLTLDSNGDGIPDVWAILNGFDPFDATVGNQDTDGDGLNNRTEYLLGTNPNRPSTLDSANLSVLRTATPLNR